MKPLLPLQHYHFEKGKSLQAGGHYNQAEAAYRTVLEEIPDDPRVWNNLGTLFEVQERFVEAEHAYTTALAAAPDSPIILFNLAHLHQADHRLATAVTHYRKAAEIRPDHFGTWFNLGHVYLELAEHEKAAECFTAALLLDPESAPAASSLGAAHFRAGKLKEARTALEAAVRLAPGEASDHFLLGRIQESLGALDDAAASYSMAISLNPRSEISQESLGRTLHAAGKHEDAIAFFRAWVEREPENGIASHMLASLSGENVPSRCSDAYVRETFDRFAGDFEATLQRLGYRAPESLAALLAAHVAPEGALTVLDAGCGTGLCAPLFRPYAAELHGVDLSSGMLARARARGGYEELVEGELVSFLRTRPGVYDLIVSADTVEYFGDLEGLFAAAREALRAGGRFLFSVERHDDVASPAGYRLQESGRYAHTAAYVREALEQHGFTVRAMDEGVLRTETGLPVVGLHILAEAGGGEDS